MLKLLKRLTFLLQMLKNDYPFTNAIDFNITVTVRKIDFPFTNAVRNIDYNNTVAVQKIDLPFTNAVPFTNAED